MQKPTFAVFLSLFAAHAAHGATFDVTNTDATGPGSFRQAMIGANDSLDASNTIQVASGLSGTITPQFISSDLPPINSQTLIINGPGADLLTLDLSSFQRLTLTSNVITFRINDLAISGGTAFRGGCLNSEHGAELLLSGVRFEDCTAVTTNTPENARGGAIYSTGMVVVADSTFVNNKAIGNTDAGAEGGAIYLQPQSIGTTLTIRRSLLNNNEARSDKDGASVSGGAHPGNRRHQRADRGFRIHCLEPDGTDWKARFRRRRRRHQRAVRRTHRCAAACSTFELFSKLVAAARCTSAPSIPGTGQSPTSRTTRFFENSGQQQIRSSTTARRSSSTAAPCACATTASATTAASSGAGSIHYGGEIDLIAVVQQCL
ncbi:MAG: hypothetical protein R3F01_09040 [Lysobacteraceae bacterium]